MPETKAIQKFDEKLVNEAVNFINETTKKTIYNGTLEIGKYVLKNFFNDDIELASSRNPHKPESYKALCKHEDLAIPHSTLTIAVRVASQEKFLKGKKVPITKLTYSHMAEMVKVPNEADKVDLAKKCITR